MAAHVGLETHHDDIGMPAMGSLRTSFTATIDIHDTQNMPFASLQTLFNLVNIATQQKIVDMKIEFWQDDAQNDAICSLAFKGWVSGFYIDGGGGVNHVLNIRLTPTLDQKQFVDLKMGN